MSTVVQSATASGTSSCSVTLPNPVSAGNGVVVLAAASHNGTTMSISGGGIGWQTVFNAGVACWYVLAAPGGNLTVTVTSSDGMAVAVLEATALTGLAQSATGTTTAASGSLVGPAVTAPSSGALVASVTGADSAHGDLVFGPVTGTGANLTELNNSGSPFAMAAGPATSAAPAYATWSTTGGGTVPAGTVVFNTSIPVTVGTVPATATASALPPGPVQTGTQVPTAAPAAMWAVAYAGVSNNETVAEPPAFATAMAFPAPVATNVNGVQLSLPAPATAAAMAFPAPVATNIPNPDAGTTPVLTPAEPAVAADTTAIYQALGPIPYLGDGDQQLGWPLLRFLDGPGQLLQRVDDLASTGPAGQPGWSILLDVERCPTYALPWLAQMVGVRFDVTQNTDAAQRQAIQAEQGFARGSLPAIRAAVEKYLKPGSSAVTIVERVGGDPYRYTVVVNTVAVDLQTYSVSALEWTTYTARTAAKATYATQAVPYAQIEAAVQAGKPGGLLVTVVFVAGPTYSETEAAYSTYRTRQQALADYSNVATYVPA